MSYCEWAPSQPLTWRGPRPYPHFTEEETEAQEKRTFPCLFQWYWGIWDSNPKCLSQGIGTLITVPLFSSVLVLGLPKYPAHPDATGPPERLVPMQEAPWQETRKKEFYKATAYYGINRDWTSERMWLKAKVSTVGEWLWLCLCVDPCTRPRVDSQSRHKSH